MRCVTYVNNRRCNNLAPYWLLDPSGKRVPGDTKCQEHGPAVVAEYKEKLGETWTLQPIDEYGDPITSEAPS